MPGFSEALNAGSQLSEKTSSRISIVLHEITPTATLIHPEEPQDRAEERALGLTTHEIATRVARRCNGLILGPHNHALWWMKRLR